MENETSLTGMVLKDSPVGEYDKRISLLTLERGRISAFLRGAKRPKGSSFQSIGPFSFGKFYIYEGRNSNSVVRAEITEHFLGIKGDLTNTFYGAYFLDVAEYYSREYTEEKERLGLLIQSLRALESGKFQPRFVLLIYELKTIAISGEYPNIFTCMGCGKKEKLTFFSFEDRVIFCDDCKGERRDLFPISEGVRYALWFIFSTPVEKLYSFKLSEQALLELREFTDRYKRRYFNHSFKTYEMLDVID